jgi:hypothetical protein
MADEALDIVDPQILQTAQADPAGMESGPPSLRFGAALAFRLQKIIDLAAT